MLRCSLVGLVCALVGVVCAPGCGGTARFEPRPGAIWLAGIRVEGNRSIDDDDLIPKLALTRAVDTGRPVDPHQLALDAGRIRAIYLRRGFFEVKVTERVDARDGAQTAVFAIDEGRRATMEVVINGLPPEIPRERARALIPIPDGGGFDYDVYDEARLPLQALVERAGYAHAQIEAYVSAERTKARAVAIYELSPGPRCTFGAAAIDGVSGPLAGAVAHRIAFREGDVYSPDALAATQRGLYELGRFSTVVVAPERVPGQTVIPVKVTVALGSRHEVRLGGGFGLDPETYEARVRAGFSYVPLGSPLWTLAGDARVAGTILREGRDFEPKIRAVVSAQRIDLLRPRLGGEVALGYDLLTVEAYTSTGPQVRLGLSSPLGVRWLSARVGWALSYLKFSGIHEVIAGTDAEVSLGLDEDQRLGAYQATIAADLRDNPLDPRSGVYLALRGQVGTPFAGGAFTFLQLTPELRGYLALGTPRLVLAARLRAGAILGNDHLPVTERYFSGGTQGHRGFPERRLSPTLAKDFSDPEDPAVVIRKLVVIGGEALLEAGAELRLQLGTLWSFPYGITAFVDGGDVWEDAYDAEPLDLHWAVGGGLSLQIAGVKVRLDVGHRLNRKGPDEPQHGKNTAVHLGIGDSF
ncbi:MAG TPA: BamA/TamA family outer membrane protein [Kofleriaceae bacterium]|nr:BamA/TamA family outer membrane protein [Kofleriaceae bacterium]